MVKLHKREPSGSPYKIGKNGLLGDFLLPTLFQGTGGFKKTTSDKRDEDSSGTKNQGDY